LLINSGSRQKVHFLTALAKIILPYQPIIFNMLFKLYLSFIVDYAQAKAFRAKNGYNQAPKHWEDIRVEVFIQ
jgi:hypothetical protein